MGFGVSSLGASVSCSIISPMKSIMCSVLIMFNKSKVHYLFFIVSIYSSFFAYKCEEMEKEDYKLVIFFYKLLYAIFIYCGLVVLRSSFHQIARCRITVFFNFSSIMFMNLSLTTLEYTVYFASKFSCS